jgi:hypothetical protein
MSTLKLRVLSILAVAVSLSACLARGDAAVPTQAPPTQPAPTVTAQPTQPPLPSPIPPSATPVSDGYPMPPTPAPTELPEGYPEPTAVPTQIEPTAQPTPDANEGVGGLIFEDYMNGQSGWHWSFSDEVVNFAVDSEREVLAGVMTTSEGWWRFTLGPDDLHAANQQLNVAARAVACETNDEYGLIFRGAERAEGGYDLYVFKLRCDGAARFERVLKGATDVLVDWVLSPAIHAGAGAENALTVWMQGGEFRFYANGQYLFSAQDDALASGYYGFYLFDRTNGGLAVNFDDLVAREVADVAAGQ